MGESKQREQGEQPVGQQWLRRASSNSQSLGCVFGQDMSPVLLPDGGQGALV